MSGDEFSDLSIWLSEGIYCASKAEAFVSELCSRIIKAGVPISRMGAFIRILHPNVIGRGFIWKNGGEVVTINDGVGTDEVENFQSAPLSIVRETRQEVRHQLCSSYPADSVLVRGLRAEGATDYIAFPFTFTNGAVHVISWTTKEPGGFTSHHVASLRKLVPMFSRVAEIMSLRRTTTTLLDTYVGNQTGELILAGQIQRGHTKLMDAVIWLSDLRGFTRMSERFPAVIVVEALNLYFGCQVPAINRQGGEILKFMGDGLLAVFPIDLKTENVPDVCARALAAAREVTASVEAIDYGDGLAMIDALRFGMALHVGKVLYGNIGGGNRMDFTCIGPAVNLAARLEKLTGKLNLKIVASREFAHHGGPDWTDLGEFEVAGFAAPERVFGLCEATVPASVGRS